MKKQKRNLGVLLAVLGIILMLLSSKFMSFVIIDIIGFLILNLDFNPHIVEVIIRIGFFVLGLVCLLFASKLYKED